MLPLLYAIPSRITLNIIIYRLELHVCVLHSI